MNRVLTAEQTRALERRAMEALDTTVAGLMARVGEAVARKADGLAPSGKIAVVAGKGNNGGDGWVAARVLHEDGREVHVHTLADPGELLGEAAEAATAALEAGVPWTLVEGPEALGASLLGAGLIVDAIFGFGVRGPVEGLFAEAIETVNAAPGAVLSVDLPSGVESDTGRVEGPAVEADHTLTVLAPKVGHALFPGAGLVGTLDVTFAGLSAQDLEPDEGLEAWTPAEYATLLPTLDSEDHKGSRGRVLVVGGSGGMAGSVCLAAQGALRAGAGYVQVAVPGSLVDVVNAKVTPAVAVGLPETEERTLAEGAAERIGALAEEADAVVIGPGLTTRPAARKTVFDVLETLDIPVVVDADALNAFAEAGQGFPARGSVTVVTPHPGELGRLLGVSAQEVQADRLAHGARLAGGEVTCVLKGARTIVSAQGRQVISMTGNPGLATMGTGDVLSGIIGAFLAQGLPGLEAGALGACVHGLAADAAVLEIPAAAMTADDVVAYLPKGVARVLEAGTGDTQ